LLKTIDTRDDKQKDKKEETTLAEGRVLSLGIHRWHNLALTFQGETITAQIDRVTVKVVSDASFAKGMAGLGTVGYARAEFDNFEVGPEPSGGSK
jgi:hypothetical protein